MSLNLTNDDGRAVDLFLDRQVSKRDGGNGPHAFAIPADELLQQRLVRVEQLLGILNQLPSVDPPADLVGRTLEFVQSAALPPAMDAPIIAADRPATGGHMPGI